MRYVATLLFLFLQQQEEKASFVKIAPYTFGNIMKQGITRDIIASSDIVIAIGTRLRDVDAKRRSVKIKELVHIDIDEQWIDKNYPSQLSFAGDLVKALHGIQHILKKRTFEWDIEGPRNIAGKRRIPSSQTIFPIRPYKTHTEGNS